MENKPIIAVDIDDVLAANAAGFIAWSNKEYGTHLTADDYQEHWAEMWKVDHHEVDRRSDTFHASDHFTTYEIIPGAKEVLDELKDDFTIKLLTSRRRMAQKMTLDWIAKYYPNVFDDCIFCGFYDTERSHGFHFTKADFAKEINASYLIDDQLKHVEAAAETGIPSLLFGDYSWNKKEQLDSNIHRVKNWSEVLEYFKRIKTNTSST